MNEYLLVIEYGIPFQDVGPTLSSPQPLSTMVGGVTDGSEGGGGESAEGAATHRELTGEEKDIACYNHEFFHGGMAKTISSKNESTKLKVSLYFMQW